jgi:hypothetical protein
MQSADIASEKLDESDLQCAMTNLTRVLDEIQDGDTSIDAFNDIDKSWTWFVTMVFTQVPASCELPCYGQADK